MSGLIRGGRQTKTNLEMLMTIEEIRKRIAEIDSMSGDPEMAHGMEDDLRADFIKYIAKNGHDPFAAMASEILKTDDMNFPRWYA